MNPATLDKLHDFSQPPPPSWTPQTIGWYVIFALILLFAAWAAWRIYAYWRHNRYRREAIRELDGIEVSAIPALLKRTVLAAWPREQVASLSGESWLQFLESHHGSGGPAKDAGHLLLNLEYRETRLSPEDENTLRRLAHDWIRRHRVRA